MHGIRKSKKRETRIQNSGCRSANNELNSTDRVGGCLLGHIYF